MLVLPILSLVALVSGANVQTVPIEEASPEDQDISAAEVRDIEASDQQVTLPTDQAAAQSGPHLVESSEVIKSDAGLALLTDLPAWVTAGSTVALVVATAVLAYLTWMLASRTARPQVVASLEPNRWAMNYLDLHLANTGNASAFDIRVQFVPPLPLLDDVREQRGKPALSEISVLRPGQHMQTSQCPFSAALEDKYEVRVEWKRHPAAKRPEKLTYTLDLTGLENLGRVGPESPEVQIAQEVKKIREDWRNITTGFKRLRVDAYSSGDRQREEQQWRARRSAMVAEQAQAASKSKSGGVRGERKARYPIKRRSHFRPKIRSPRGYKKLA